MTPRIIRAIQQALQSRWFARLPGIILYSREMPARMPPGEAYGEGYRQGYWDAVVDMAEADLLKDPETERRSPIPQAWAEEYH